VDSTAHHCSTTPRRRLHRHRSRSSCSKARPLGPRMAGQGRAQGQVGTLPRPGTTGAAAPWLVPVAGRAGPLAAKLREWAAVEVAPGRLIPWQPVHRRHRSPVPGRTEPRPPRLPPRCHPRARAPPPTQTKHASSHPPRSKDGPPDMANIVRPKCLNDGKIDSSGRLFRGILPSSLSDLSDNPLISLKPCILPSTKRPCNINGLEF
jgi:hypothetical protein